MAQGRARMTQERRTPGRAAPLSIFEDRPRSGTLIDSEIHLGTAGNRDPFSLCH